MFLLTLEQPILNLVLSHFFNLTGNWKNILFIIIIILISYTILILFLIIILI